MSTGAVAAWRRCGLEVTRERSANHWQGIGECVKRIKKEPGGNPALQTEREGTIDEKRPVVIVSHETDLQSTSTHNHPNRVEGKTIMGIKKSDAFPKKYIKVDDLGGRKIAAVIDRVEMEEVGDKDKPVVYFEDDAVKPLVLNNTNWS